MLLSGLETELLKAICQRAPAADATALEEQLKHVTVRRRDNTGVGFYTQLHVDHVTAKAKDQVLGNVFAKVAGLQNPITFLLFIKNGVVDLLEGAATDESTVNIDFSKVTFEFLWSATRGRS